VEIVDGDDIHRVDHTHHESVANLLNRDHAVPSREMLRDLEQRILIGWSLAEADEPNPELLGCCGGERLLRGQSRLEQDVTQPIPGTPLLLAKGALKLRFG